jgi:hypothetical protein
MRRAALVVLLFSLVMAPAAAAAKQTSTPVRITAPSAANATVAGFELDLVRVKKRARGATATAAALPKNVSIYAVVGKQKRSDRVKGVLVAVNRASAVSAAAVHKRVRRLTVNLKHAAVPKGFKLTLKLKQAADVLGRHRAFKCATYFKPSDLAGAGKLSGPGLPGITLGTIIQSACSASRSEKPFATLGEFRGALNAPSGTLGLLKSATVPNDVDGTATFNYGARAFGVLADPKHQFTSCASPAGTCAISSTKGHTNDYALVTLTAPAAAGTQLPLSLVVSPSPTPALPFQFFGFDSGNHRLGPLLTTGPT